MADKPLGHKNYGSIGHLPRSRTGPGDHSVHEGQTAICLQTPRDWRDVIVVQEKLDGSNVGVAKVGERQIVPLGRAGYRAETSPYRQHHLFAKWVMRPSNWARFDAMLCVGERVVGEWLIQAHGTRYELHHEPFVIFDVMEEHERLPYMRVLRRVIPHGFVTPRLISYGPPVSVDYVLKQLRVSGHGAVDPVEGAVWRVERDGSVDFLAKYVRPEKEDGIYLPGIGDYDEEVWNKGAEEYVTL